MAASCRSRLDGGDEYDHACNIVVMPNGCLYVTGFGSGSPTFDRGGAAERTLVGQGNRDGWRYFVSPRGTFDQP